MNGSSILSYTPLHFNALEREEGLTAWVQSWLGITGDFAWLSPEGWYKEG